MGPPIWLLWVLCAVLVGLMLAPIVQREFVDPAVCERYVEISDRDSAWIGGAYRFAYVDQRRCVEWRIQRSVVQ